MGTLFLWVFWPSFNSALTFKGDDQHRAILNTFGPCASTMTAFALSFLLNKTGKLAMADVQNVTLAGGVAVGTSVDMMISPAVAYALGMAGATACMPGFKYLTPFLAQRCRIQDQCGIHNLHGLTGLISCAAGYAPSFGQVIMYGPSLYELFAHRAPVADDPKLVNLQQFIPGAPGLGRTAQEQALFQARRVSVTGGVGFVLRQPVLPAPSDEFCFDDELFFDVPHD